MDGGAACAEDASSVQVAVRVRPLTGEEVTVPASINSRSRFLRQKHNNTVDNNRAWTCSSTTLQQVGSGRKVEGKSLFSFDHVFDEDESTTKLYEAMVRPIVKGITKGKHGTVFCYGQTGSGKTFTMQGQARDNSDGVLQLAMKDLFRWIGKSDNDSSMVIVSYFEIYNERVKDLLSGVVSDQESESGDSVRSGRHGEGPHVRCRQVQVNDVDTVLELLGFGNRHRTVASTNMNSQSSRSHAIFRVAVETRGGTLRKATLNLVDLAGSENSNLSGTTHQRQKEGGKINQSLLSLSKVIHALSMPKSSRPQYINYRDSKLTFILQPHLSGNASMAILCCVSPASQYIEETRSTLRFASRAKLVETKAQVNEVVEEVQSLMIQSLKEELDATRKALEVTERRSAASEMASVEATSELKRLKHLIFGGVNIDLDSQANLTKKQNAIDEHYEFTVPNIADISNDSLELLDNNMSNFSYQRVTKRRDEVAKRPSHPRLPTEVLIMNEPISNLIHASARNPSDVEHQCQFLLSRLEATEDMVDLLRKERMSARKAIHQLVETNVSLRSKADRCHRKIAKLQEDSQGQYHSQYVLLKWSMYLSLAFFFFGLQDLFLVMVMFVWLTLESYTSGENIS